MNEKVRGESFFKILKLFLIELKENQILLYTYIVTILLMVFFSIVSIIFGPVNSLPIPFTVPSIQDITFLLLITFSFFLLFLFIVSFNKSLKKRIFKNHVIFWLFGIHIIIFFISLLIPAFIFYFLYIFAYFLWYTISALFLVLLARDLSSRLIGSIIFKQNRKDIIAYLLFWIGGFIIFGIFFTQIEWNNFSFNQQIILMVFPIFIIILPVIGLIIKPKEGKRAPISLYSFVIFLFLIYHWYRYLNWTSGASKFSYVDLIMDIILISYSFFSLFKNAKLISQKLDKKLQIDQLLFLFIWSRISSMIILLTVSNYTFFGYSASEGVYLATMFLIIIFGLILGILWVRRGLTKSDLKIKISTPKGTKDSIK